MMYKIANRDDFADELQEAILAQTKGSNFIMTAMNLKKVDFEKHVITKLLNCKNEWNFEKHLKGLRKNGLLGHDDYSLVFF